MISYQEWSNANVKLTFAEKYSMFMSRLSVLSSLVSLRDSTFSSNTKNKLDDLKGRVQYGIKDERSVKEIIKELDSMWKEIKSEF